MAFEGDPAQRFPHEVANDERCDTISAFCVDRFSVSQSGGLLVKMPVELCIFHLALKVFKSEIL